MCPLHQDAIKSLIDIALVLILSPRVWWTMEFDCAHMLILNKHMRVQDLSKIKEFTGREKPTVIT